MKEARIGEPIIYDGQHTSELHTVPKACLDIGEIVAPIWEVADERRLQHHLRADIELKGNESENRKGAGESKKGCPISLCL